MLCVVHTGSGVPQLRDLGTAIIYLPFLFYQGFKFLLVKKPSLSIHRSAEKTRLTPTVILIVTGIISAVFLLRLLAYFPGGMGWDSIQQWKQVQAGAFNDWHPAIHTMIIWLVTRIVDHYTFFLAVQILVFAFVAGYLVATLLSWGVHRYWAYAFVGIILLSHSTPRIFMHPWKDTMVTILMVALAAYVVNIVFSNGRWIAKWYNAVALAIVGALITVVRHNGFFITLPCAVLLIIFYRKTSMDPGTARRMTGGRGVLIAVLGGLLIVIGITQGLYRLADVEKPPSQTYIESVGIPMSMLGHVMVTNPDALDADTLAFLTSIADEDTWQEWFTTGYNSIKWETEAYEKVGELPPRDLASMTMRTIRSAPFECLVGFGNATRVVWSPIDWLHTVNVGRGDFALDVAYTQAEVDAWEPVIKPARYVHLALDSVIQLLAPDRVLSIVGLHAFLLLVIGVYSVNRRLGMKALFIIGPVLVYNMGTMLLLGGPDYRYFHFNILVSLPFIIALLAKTTNENLEVSKESNS
jgi:hypothetical protein